MARRSGARACLAAVAGLAAGLLVTAGGAAGTASAATTGLRGAIAFSSFPSLSGGGYGATMIALHHPGTFPVLESWSGYFHATDPAGTAALDLGSEEANDRAEAHKLIPKVRALLSARGSYFAFYVGTNDKLFRAENVLFAEELQAAGLGRVVFRLYRGGHDWALWARHSVGWLDRALAVATQPTTG
jgi:S-formylglutathione hydrolase FrmB